MTENQRLAQDIARMRADIARLGSRAPRYLRQDLAAALREQGTAPKPQTAPAYPCTTHGEW